eukprot:428615_1
MELFTLATNGLWIDDDAYINSINSTKNICNDNNNNNNEHDIEDDKLYAFGVYRCNNKPATCYKNKNINGHISIQSCVDKSLSELSKIDSANNNENIVIIKYYEIIDFLDNKKVSI